MGWITFYRFCGELAEYKPEDREKLGLYQQLLESCFALWILPGRVILCERPSHVEIKDGKVKNMRWER